jgi:hypothetical protein
VIKAKWLAAIKGMFHHSSFNQPAGRPSVGKFKGSNKRHLLCGENRLLLIIYLKNTTICLNEEVIIVR